MKVDMDKVAQIGGPSPRRAAGQQTAPP